MVSVEAEADLAEAAVQAVVSEESRSEMITLYTRTNCPLCDEAKLMLQLVQEDFPVDYIEIDIESDDRLHEKYMLMIPVLEKDNEVLLYGNIGYVDLLEALKI